MTGRRSHPRFAVASPWDGTMRVLRDVVVDRTTVDELLAVSQAPGVLGETMTLDLMGGGVTMALRVVVVESRPVIISGAVRHRIRLSVLRPASSETLTASSNALPASSSNGDLAGAPAEAH
jgi:hypothetical protein